MCDLVRPWPPPHPAGTPTRRAAVRSAGETATAPTRTFAQPAAESSPTWLLPTGRPWQAIAAGCVGLIGLLAVVLFPLSIGFGVWGLSVIKKDGGTGEGRCWFGIVSGIWDVLVIVLVTG